MNVLPLSGCAAQLDFSAQQAGQLAADGESQSGSAVFAAGAGVCLLKRLEDDSLLLRRNTDSGIGDLEGNHGCGACRESGWSSLHPPAATETDKLHASVLRELECVGQQILEHLLQTFRIGDQAARKVLDRCALQNSAAGFLLRGGTAEPPYRAGWRRRLLRHRLKRCPIRSSKDRECR